MRSGIVAALLRRNLNRNSACSRAGPHPDRNPHLYFFRRQLPAAKEHRRPRQWPLLAQLAVSRVDQTQSVGRGVCEAV